MSQSQDWLPTKICQSSYKHVPGVQTTTLESNNRCCEQAACESRGNPLERTPTRGVVH